MKVVNISQILEIDSEFNITPIVAIQKANRYLITKVGNLLSAKEPELVVSDKLYWRVPVIYALPSKGKLGKVGEIWIDADTSELILEKSTDIELMRLNAKILKKKVEAF
ncbi:MAG: hypothetical protein ACE5KE_04645 [Methanosarcinales archaeon]